MESQSRNCGAVEGDRLSGLPDEILYSILHCLPLKDVVRTSSVSHKFEKKWLGALATSPVLDFTDRNFVSGSDQTPARVAGTVERYLELHDQHGGPLHVLRVALNGALGGIIAFVAEKAVGWVVSAVARGAREVEVDLTPVQRDWAAVQPDADNEILFLELPGGLFLARNSLVRLALDQFSLRAVPPGAAGLAGLRSLSLSHADVTDEGVQTVLSSCHSLEFLSLRRCHLLTSVMIIGEKLRSLEVVSCQAVRGLRVTAPALESFAFHGDIVYMRDEDGNFITDLGATPLLRDAYLSHIGVGELFDIDYDNGYSNFISCVTHAQTLTICSAGLQMINQDGYNEDFNIDLTNVQELQLLMDCFDYINLADMFRFFKLFPLPLLDRLFIRVIFKHTNDGGLVAQLIDKVVDSGAGNLFYGIDFVLDRLRLIKVVNLWGTMSEMMMLAFLLKRTPALEQLVLVAVDGEGAPGDELMEMIQHRVSMMRMASPDVRITLCRPSEDRSEGPTHSRMYHEE